MGWERKERESDATKVLLEKIKEIAQAIAASNGKTTNEIVSDQKVSNALDTFHTLLEQAKQNHQKDRKPGGRP